MRRKITITLLVVGLIVCVGRGQTIPVLVILLTLVLVGMLRRIEQLEDIVRDWKARHKL